jgi:uncharacterized membrane protein YfcA
MLLRCPRPTGPKRVGGVAVCQVPGVDAIEAIALVAAGAGAGAVNAVAGGGSLVSFPALLAVGYAPVAANVTNQVGLVPGYLGGSHGYRAELAGQRGRARSLGVAVGLGAAAGSALLLLAPAGSFRAIVPYLVLLACALLALQPALMRAAGRHRAPHPGTALHLGTFAAGVYGGYFGGALGIVLLALLGALLEDGLQRLNALKGMLSLLAGLVGAVVFAVFGPVAWGAAALVAGGSLIGGRAGASLARRLHPSALRWGIVTYGVAAAVVLLV